MENCLVYNFVEGATPKCVALMLSKLKDNKEDDKNTLGSVLEKYGGWFLITRDGWLMLNSGGEWQRRDRAWLIGEFSDEMERHVPRADLLFQGVHTARLFYMYGFLWQQKGFQKGKSL